MKTTGLAILLVLTTTLSAKADTGAPRMNVLFLVADDLNSWLLEDADRYAGKVVAPNLRRLAGSGVNFTRAYTAAPVCSPSRTAFFSGVAPWRSGVYNNAQTISKSEPLNQDAVLSLAGLFKTNGYNTFGYGKITHGWDQKQHWNEHVGHKRDPAPPGAPLAKLSGGEQDWGPIHLTEEQMNDTGGANKAIAILKKQHDKPFFLAYGSFNPHMPWYVPQKYFDMYPLDQIVLPELKEGDLDDLPPLAKAVSDGVGSFADKVIKSGKHKEAVQAYLATTTYVDTQFGRVFDALDNSPYKDNTIVVFLTDHGFHLGEKLHWQKTTLWEEGTHTLLMFRAPGVTTAGGVSERFVSLMDIYPTLAELCGLTPPAYLDGRSLVPLLKDPQAPWESTAITGLCDKGKTDLAYVSIRHELGRYTRYGEKEEEFYDTAKDPHEWTNQIDNPKYATTVKKLRALVPGFEEAAQPLPTALTRERRETQKDKKKEKGKKEVKKKADAVKVTESAQKPNFIIILADDLGFGDLGCYGADDVATPHIDQMAREGTKFTSFYVSSVCSPTRASLMTGCLAQRVGIGGVLFPRNNHGLNPDESTLPELLKEQGYATSIIGKWHLGNQDMFQPLNHGFDHWFGTPSSNSQGFDPAIKQYAEDCVWREGYTRESILKLDEAKCPLIRNNVVIEVPADQTQFTQRYTREAVRFITEHKETPFFLYLPHNMVHIPVHASAEFVGKSTLGIYGDAIQELDWSTGEILKTLKDLGLDENTLVIFTSDNGPHLGQGGTAGPLRGAKGSTFEGGVRVPCIARWPGRIPADRETDEPTAIMDLLPTLITLAGGSVPNDRVIDGRDIWQVMAGSDKAKSPHEAIYYLKGRGVNGIRIDDWKFLIAPAKEVLPEIEVELTPEEQKLPRRQRNALMKERTKAAQGRQGDIEMLFNLREDPGESTNLIDQHPEVATRLKIHLEAFEAEFGKTLRPAGVAE